MPEAVVQRALLQGLMSLPRSAMRLMAGGGVVYRGGRTLDPRLQLLAHLARRQRPLSALTPHEARRQAHEALKAMEGRLEPGVTVEPLTIDMPGPDLGARV